jgi:hypothetical protein
MQGPVRARHCGSALTGGLACRLLSEDRGPIHSELRDAQIGSLVLLCGASTQLAGQSSIGTEEDVSLNSTRRSPHATGQSVAHEVERRRAFVGQAGDVTQFVGDYGEQVNAVDSLGLDRD